jgi:hypothetical protein
MNVKVTPAEVDTKRWWEGPLGIITLGLLVTVIGGLILWAITRHYDKSTPSTPVEQPKAQPQPARPEPKAQEPQNQPTYHRSSDKKKTKIEQHGEGSGAIGGNINQGPCSNLQIGGSNNQATTNCVQPNVTYNYDGSQKKTVSGGSSTLNVSVPNELVAKIQSEIAAGQEQQALLDAQTLMTSDPMWATPHVLAGLAYINLGNQGAAKTELAKAKGLVPSGYEYEQDYSVHLQHLEEAIKKHEPRQP